MTREEKFILIKKLNKITSSMIVFLGRRPLAKKTLIDDDEDCFQRRTLLACYRSEPEFIQFVDDYNSLHHYAKELIENPCKFF